MKVAVYLGEHSPQVGGGYTFAAEVFAAFEQLAPASPHEFVVFADRQAAALLAGRALPANVRVAALPARGLLSRFLEMLQRDSAWFRLKVRWRNRVQALAEQQRVELVWFIASASVWLDVPYVAVVWDLQHRTLPWFPEFAHAGEYDAREAANAHFLRRAVAVITGTDTGVREITSLYQVPVGHVRVLPHPTPADALAASTESTARARAEVAARYGLDRPYLIYPAQFWPHKNHVNLLLALAELRDTYARDLLLVMPGSDKGNRAHCEAHARAAGVFDACRFAGFVERVELVALYAGASALTYVSFGGPENLPPLEAMALGCPVIAADVPGAREQLGDCAVYVDPASPREIAGAVHRVLAGGAEVAARRDLARARAEERDGRRYVTGVFGLLDEFGPIRRAWGVA
jgi:glycosyltransferase involved in cell wall biosynthesis